MGCRKFRAPANPFSLNLDTIESFQTTMSNLLFSIAIQPHYSPLNPTYNPSITMACSCERCSVRKTWQNCTVQNTPKCVNDEVILVECSQPGGQNCTGYNEVFLGSPTVKVPGHMLLRLAWLLSTSTRRLCKVKFFTWPDFRSDKVR